MFTRCYNISIFRKEGIIFFFCYLLCLLIAITSSFDVFTNSRKGGVIFLLLSFVVFTNSCYIPFFSCEGGGGVFFEYNSQISFVVFVVGRG